MASNPLGPCCFTGFKHEGTPSGVTKTILDVTTYFAYPENNKHPDKVVIILSDIFGIYNNSQLIADDFAANGYLAIIPDLFNGDAVLPETFEAGKYDRAAWVPKHGPEQTDPVIDRVIKSLRDDLNIKTIGGVGYCFGGRYVGRFLKEGKLDAGFVAHPSFLSKEELGAIEKPLSIAAAETDRIFTSQLRHESEEILIKTSQPFQINLFSGVAHGFAVRADLSKPANKFAKEQAFLQAVGWFNHHL